MLQRLGVPISASDREGRVTEVSFESLVELVNTVPLVQDDPGPWSADAVIEILNNYRQDRGDFGFVYVRQLDGDPNRSRARLSGNEVNLIRAASRSLPALALLYVGEAERPEGWYPTLVMPPDSPNFIISPADD
jgi:hypothetical protein